MPKSLEIGVDARRPNVQTGLAAVIIKDLSPWLHRAVDEHFAEPRVAIQARPLLSSVGIRKVCIIRRSAP